MKFEHIKAKCGQVLQESTRKSKKGYIERCGFYNKRACNQRNCPIYNQVRGYESITRDIESAKQSVL